MAENSPPPNPDQNPANQEELVEQSFPEMLDEQGLEDFLTKEAPEFTLSLTEIEQDKDLVAADVNLSDDEQALAEEINLWQNSKGFKKKVYRLLPFVPRLSLKYKKLKFRLFTVLRAWWVRIKNFSYFLATDGKKKILENLKIFIGIGIEFFASKIKKFKAKPLKLKLIAFGIFVFAGLTTFFIYRSITTGILKKDTNLFIASMAEVATKSYSYDPETETEYFYDNLKANQNLILLKKIFLNLKKSEKSGPNPMAAFEFFIEGAAPEVIIEIKDREGPIVDAVQRELEQMTFESLETSEGKELMLEKLKKQINSVLTTGSVKKVLIKNVVLKP